MMQMHAWCEYLKDKSESFFRVKLEERKFWQDLQLSGVLEFWKLEMGDRKYPLIVCELKESESHLQA